MGLDIDEDDCTIRLSNTDMDNIDLEDVVKIRVCVNDINVKLFIKRECINGRLDLCDDMLVFIKLYIKDKLTPGGKKIQNGFEKLVMPEDREKERLDKYALVIYPEYYRNLYFCERIDLDKKELWYVMFACRSFQELYNVSGNIIDEDMRNIFISSVVDKCKKINKKEEDWQRKKRNEYANRIWEVEKEEYSKGLRVGTDGTINQCIIKMLKENLDVELISRVTDKNIDDINVFRRVVIMFNENIDVKEIARIMEIDVEYINVLKRIYCR